MADGRCRFVDDCLIAHDSRHAVAHVHVVVIVGVEPSRPFEEGPPHRHVGAYEVSQRPPAGRKTVISASEYPIELHRKPGRSASLENRYGTSANGSDPFILVRVSENR